MNLDKHHVAFTGYETDDGTESLLFKANYKPV